MREKGFATIFGLCLILALALILQSIQIEQRNHVYETAGCQAEFDLQNAADSGIYAAADKVLRGEVTLPVKDYNTLDRQDSQHEFDTIIKTSKHVGTITVETWGECVNLNHRRKLYPSNKLTAKGTDSAYIFFSKAEATSEHTGGKIYRRAFAYVLQGGDQTIHFME